MAFKAFWVFVFSLFLTACASGYTPKIEPPRQSNQVITHSDAIEMGKDATIAFVSRSLQKDEHYFPQCSGFWIDKDTIMTALHCAQGAARIEKIRKFPLKDREEAGKKVPRIKDPTGFVMSYIVESEVTGINAPPTNIHKAKVVAIDETHDMALLKADEQNMPSHGWLYVAKQMPRPGDKVYVIGHPGDLYYTVMDGMISAVRDEYPFDQTDAFNVAGPVIQVFSAIFKGNSGGAVISEKGEVLGVVSFTVKAPNQGFAVAPPSMQNFLADSKSKNLL